MTDASHPMKHGSRGQLYKQHGDGVNNGKLAQQQVFGVVYFHKPELVAMFDFVSAVVDLLQPAGADNGSAVIVVALNGVQADDAALSTAHPVYSLTSENSSLNNAMSSFSE